MGVRIFEPSEIVVGPIGPMMASKISNEGLRKFIESKGSMDGNLSSIVVGDSENMGVGVGTWAANQFTKTPVPVVFDEVLVIVQGTFICEIEGTRYHAKQGEIIHIPQNSMVTFGSNDGCRLVWITSPPTWRALERAWEGGSIQDGP